MTLCHTIDGEKVVRQKPSLPPKPNIPKKPVGGPGVPVGPPQRVQATMRTLPSRGPVAVTPPPASNTLPRSPSALAGGEEGRTNSLTRGIQKMLRAASRSSKVSRTFTSSSSSSSSPSSRVLY
ncbi:hypothetical protein E2C01_018991 [Portunus trituberculatus]|uniref:Uncharacterized protein n=1 Tax=Portunus trituberculatus TaxID=210409 RepID=A0A5B7DWR2_PORTR|nr:hypothetical protein [Portunus trituberculatus]